MRGRWRRTLRHARAVGDEKPRLVWSERRYLGEALARHGSRAAARGAALDEAIGDAAPDGPFRALDVGCGPGTTSLALAARRPDAAILGCDLSHSLVAIASERAPGAPNVQFIAEDAESAAREHGPFDLIFSRHGVMFFDDPYRAFRTLREATTSGGRLVFSCFRAWDENPWAEELASAAAGSTLPPPGREPGGFAFADVDYVREILTSAGWTDAEPRPLDFDYDAGSLEEAMSFLVELGPASRVMDELEGSAREAAANRVREAVRRHERDGRVTFRGAAWIWTAAA